MFGLSTLCRSSAAFDLLGRVPLRGRPRYTQEQSATKKVMDGDALLAAAAVPKARPKSSHFATQVALLEMEQKQQEDEEQGQIATNALCLTSDAVDDDIVLDDVHGKHLREVAVSSEREKFCEHHPAARGIGMDIIDMVTDAFKEERERLIAERRRVLYELTHPNPSDYTYNGKLVPPPPLTFGKIAEESKSLGNKIMLGQHYTLVKQAGVRRENGNTITEVGVGRNRSQQGQGRGRGQRKTTMFDNHNFFFEINELYQEIVLVGKACAGKSSLLNALLGQPVAKTSSTPNTTRQISFYQSVSPEEMQNYLNKEGGNGLVKLPGGGLQLTFVDVPGFGIEGMSDQWRDKAIELTDAYLGVRRSVNTVLLCIDCERGLTKTDLKYFTWLENLHGVFFVVLTKCDSVPHSRICSVMRQIYSAITKHRRKYRKVFPFIIPTSAKDGTNVEYLRGLIAETSGLIPGDRLRQILKKKADAEMQIALEEEAKRVQEARCIETQKAKAFFAATRGNGNQTLLSSSQELTASSTTMKERKFVLNLDQNSQRKDSDAIRSTSASTTEPLLTFPRGDNMNGSGIIDDDEKTRRRQRFLAWRREHPLQRHQSDYGTFRLNTGLDRPDAAWLELPYMEKTTTTTANAEVEKVSSSSSPPTTEENPVSSSSSSSNSLEASSQSAVLGVAGSPPPSSQRAGGTVSRFLDVLERYGGREAPLKRFGRRAAAREARLRRHCDPAAAPTLFFAEEPDGRVAPFRAGRKCGPSLVAPDTKLAVRGAAWAARRYAKAAVAEAPTAPWTALETLRRRAARLREEAAAKGMKAGELQAYMRNAGGIAEDFAKFEGEVSTAKWMNEVRQAKTLRSQQQMHFNSTAKISYRSMPVGLWKHYGEKDTYWPTPRVQGR
ncbi:GTP binding domain [Trypanosoma melophagium]|uniref:GTP binding domain n=1 Tax=Trypanosoma melophagium TaxID=715481 RepID=UPI00351A22C6|nr:GTP binding domain [Trypanosoma melophagium]